MEPATDKERQKLFTTREAAAEIRLTQRTIQRAIREGRLKATKHSANRKIIHKRNLYAYTLFGRSRISAAEQK